MGGGKFVGLMLLGAIIAFAIYALRRGRSVKPDDYRARDWIGFRDRPDDEDFPKGDR